MTASATASRSLPRMGFAALFMAFGLFLAVRGIRGYFLAASFLNGRKTVGTVTALPASEDEPGPVVRLAADSGQSVVFTSGCYNPPPGYNMGQQVDVLQKQDGSAEIADCVSSMLWFRTATVSIMALGFIGAGGMVLRQRSRQDG